MLRKKECSFESSTLFFKKGAVSNLFLAQQHPFPRKGVLFCKMVPLYTGVLFSTLTFGPIVVRALPLEIQSVLTNMIIKEKKHPSEKRVLFVAIVPQGYYFGTLFSVSVVIK